MQQKVTRCAVYTRKSVEEGLDQEFNSLDAQRLACESYIAAKRLEGWTCLPTRYDDNGYSGGNMKRPAFQRLMADMRLGRIDMVVCYKIDRLSRSLMDFAQIFKEFENADASFASVTQEFNTSTSMGRMVLNLLMTFAQFEREMTADRVRDKVAATRRKGMWSGGVVPYGYRVENRRLVVDPATAPNVRRIFEWYAELGTPKLVCRRLAEQGIVRPDGKPWDTPRIGTILRNPIYIGKIPLKGILYDGLHEAVVSRDMWDKASRRLSTVVTTPATRTRSTVPALLTGLLRCGHCGSALSHTWTTKSGSGVRYAYYTCRKDMRRGISTCPVKAVPAQLIEPLVESEVAKRLAPDGGDSSAFWEGRPPAERHELIAGVVAEIVIFSGSIEIRYRSESEPKVIPVTFKTVCGRRRLEIAGHGEVSDIRLDETNVILRAFARAREWTRMIESGAFSEIKELAEAVGVDRAKVVRTLRLANLSPRIFRAVVRKELPPDFAIQKLWSIKSDIWEEQEKEIGL